MTVETERTHGPNTEAPEYFVVEISSGRYAICQRTMLLTPGADDPARALIEGYLERQPLRAAVMPGASSGGDRQGPPCPPPDAYRGQTAYVVVNVHPPCGDPPKQ